MSNLPSLTVLDGFTANPGDLSWDPLHRIVKATIHDRTPPDCVVERAADAPLLWTNKVVLDAAILEQLPQLRYIGVLATGYNVVDLEVADRLGITVTNVPGYSTQSVAQLTFALILELAHRTGHHSRACQDGRWSKGPDWCFWDYPLLELDGRTLGLVGYGAIAKATARIAQAMGMHVIAYQPSRRDEGKVELADLDEIFSRSDIVSLHCPLDESNRGMVNAKRLALMKPSAFLINTARGALVCEQDLAQALSQGKIAGAGLDVLSTEPPSKENPLLSAPHCIITPHIAWATKSARERLLDTAVKNLQAFLQGHPANVVNHPGKRSG
jgi:glycerate dehydrogenase